MLRFFLDTNPLLSRVIRDWILKAAMLAPRDVRLYTSQDVLDEWGNHYRNMYPLAHGREIERHRQKIQDTCTVVTDYDVAAIAQLHPEFPDIHDYHVIAAADIAAGEVGIDYLVTDDKAMLAYEDKVNTDGFSYTIASSDSALISIAKLNPVLVQTLVLSEFKYRSVLWTRDANSSEYEVDIVRPLIKAGCPAFAEHVRQILHDPWVDRETTRIAQEAVAAKAIL